MIRRPCAYCRRRRWWFQLDRFSELCRDDDGCRRHWRKVTGR